tara:strand:+ start:1586 stop:1882 length:297 start_codon:yes stop_codon:yes gene_type:complete
MIVIKTDIEYDGSYYYYNEENGFWYGHQRSHFIPMIGEKRSCLVQGHLNKIAIKMGYKLPVIKKEKKVRVVTKSKNPTKSVTAKRKAKVSKSSFISLF